MSEPYLPLKQIKIEDGQICLPKAGWTRMVMHRRVIGRVENVTVSDKSWAITDG